MKLLLIGLCFIGFIAAIGRYQEFRVSGLIQCCTDKWIIVVVDDLELESNCLPPYKAELEFIERKELELNRQLKANETVIFDGARYFLEWKGETLLTVRPFFAARVYCKEDQQEPFERLYSLFDSSEELIKQNIIVNY